MNSLVGPSSVLTSSFNPFHRVSSVASGFYTNSGDSPEPPPPDPDPAGNHILHIASTDGNFLLINDRVDNLTPLGDDYWMCSLGYFAPTADDYQVSNKRQGTGYTTSPVRPVKKWNFDLSTPFSLTDPPWSSVADYVTSAINFGYRFRSLFNYRYLGLIDSNTSGNFPKYPCLIFIQQTAEIDIGARYAFLTYQNVFKFWVYRLPLVNQTEVRSFWIDSERNPSLPSNEATHVRFLEDARSTDLTALTLLNSIVDSLGGFCIVVAIRR